MLRSLIIVGLFVGLVVPIASVDSASSYADPAFRTQWQQGEAITPNFWGPLANAKDGQQEPYKDAHGGQRLVQYFDKGRMELTNGAVTNGLLATEIIKGQIQTGDAVFQAQSSPAIPIAGDPDNVGPTYAQLGGKAKALFDASPSQTGNITQATVSSGGDISASSTSRNDQATFVTFDDATKHNVPKAFADYRAKANLLTIGLALCEPFYTTVKVGGQQKQVMVQVFERRVLTYTASNDPAFQVEMGNIGQHYYQWRYGLSTSPSIAPPPTQVPPSVAPAPKPTVLPSPTQSAPTDDNTYRQFLQQKFANVGSHALQIDNVRIFHSGTGSSESIVVSFEVTATEALYLLDNGSQTDLHTWGQNLLAELKMHWPGLFVIGNLEETYYSFDYIRSSDCHYISDDIDVDRGWYQGIYFVKVSYLPFSGGSDSNKVCYGH